MQDCKADRNQHHDSQVPQYDRTGSCGLSMVPDCKGRSDTWHSLPPKHRWQHILQEVIYLYPFQTTHVPCCATYGCTSTPTIYYVHREDIHNHYGLHRDTYQTDFQGYRSQWHTLRTSSPAPVRSLFLPGT